MRALLLSLALGLSGAACSHAGPVPEPRACSSEVRRGEVLLRVVDARGRPIPRARISLNSRRPGVASRSESVDGRLTDADGEARLTLRLDEGLSPFVHITAEGYQGRDWTLDLLPGEQRRVDVRLWSSATVSGRVVDASGQPVPGLEVVGSSVLDHNTVSRATTDAGGGFSLPELIPGPVSLSVSRPGQQARFSAEAVAPQAGVELSWKPSALSVWVRDARGQPLPGALVHVQPVSEFPLPGSVWNPRTDAEGKVELGTLTPGLARVQAWWVREGFTWLASREVSLAAGQRHTAELSFEGSRARPPLTGRVTDERGEPMPGVDVVATPLASPVLGSLRNRFWSEGLYEQSKTESDAEGRFTLSGLREGPVQVWASARDEVFDEPSAVDVPPGRDEVTVVMPRKSTLQGTVVDSEGKPVERVLVWVDDKSAFKPSGRLEDIVVPEGRVTVTLVAEGFAAEQRTVQVPARKAFRFTEPIVLQPERTVRGRVVRADGCTPVPGAAVMLDRKVLPDSDTTHPLVTRTDAEGRFTLGRLKREPLVLRVSTEPISFFSPRDRMPSVRQPVGAGEDSVTVRFGPGVSLTGVVTDGEGRPLRGAQLGTSCKATYQPIDAAGRYVLHGLQGGQECVLSVSPGREGPAPVFTPRRVVLPERGSLRVDLAARRGPASLRIWLPRGQLSAFLLEGEVPMPKTVREAVPRFQTASRPDPELIPSRTPEDAPREVLFTQLTPGRYTLLVSGRRPGVPGEALLHVPVTLDGPGVKRVEVDFAAARTLETD